MKIIIRLQAHWVQLTSLMNSASACSYISYINQDAVHQRKETTRQHKRHKTSIFCVSVQYDCMHRYSEKKLISWFSKNGLKPKHIKHMSGNCIPYKVQLRSVKNIKNLNISSSMTTAVILSLRAEVSGVFWFIKSYIGSERLRSTK